MYTARLYEEARALPVGLRLMPDIPGMMYVEYGYVEGPHPDYERSVGIYPNMESRVMTCLHELGHAWYGHTQGRPPFNNSVYYFETGVLRSEAEAWLFALDRAAEWEIPLDDATRSFMWDTCLGSYYRGAIASNFQPGQRLTNGDRGYYAFTYDRPSEFFWSVAEQLKPGVREAHEQTPARA